MMVLKNVTYYDFTSFSDHAYVVFEDRIQIVGDMKDFDATAYQDHQILDVADHLVMPALVVGHTHIYSTLSRGLSVPFDPKDFKELLEQLWWKVDAQLGEEEIYYSGIVSGVEYVKNGVTTLIDHHASGLKIEGSLEVLRKALMDNVSLRGIFCFETSDRFDVEACILENLSFIAQHKSSRVRGLFGAHASFTLSEKSLSRIKDRIGDTPLHIHVAESLQDQEICQRLYGERVIERLDRFGLLNRNSLLSHCIHLSRQEKKLIKQRGCVVAVNVSSNMNNGVGLPDLVSMRSEGIKLIIGNDGISSSIVNEWATLLFCMHHQEGSPIRFNFNHLLEMIEATYDYANTILETKLGKIEVGYESDLLILPYCPPTPLNLDSALGHLIFGLSSSFKPKHVFCAGQWLVKDYEVSEALNKQYKQAREHGKRLWQKIKEQEVKK